LQQDFFQAGHLTYMNDIILLIQYISATGALHDSGAGSGSGYGCWTRLEYSTKTRVKRFMPNVPVRHAPKSKVVSYTELLAGMAVCTSPVAWRLGKF
jgi:hypothetical protein